MRIRPFAIAGALVTASACFSSSSPPAPAGAVTFHKDVEPILQKSCQMCHQPGGIAPFSLMTYADAKPHAADMVLQTQNRVMPPWGAQNTSECAPRFPWKGDLRLSDAALATIKAWHDDGDYEGDPKDAPPPITTPPPTSLPGSQSLAPDTPFQLTQTSDYFRCFVLDPKITSATYLTGTNIIPGNKTIVHHALVFSVPLTAQIPAPTDGVPGQYDCFGGVGISSGTSLIAAWAPGGIPYEYPAGVAQQVQAGTRFVMQIHYHPHANATTDPDTTTFQYKLDTTPPQWIVAPTLIGNFAKAVDSTGNGLLPGPDDPASGPAFLIPPDTANHVETMQFTLPSTINGNPMPPLKILTVAGHMHLVGQDIKLDMTRAAPTATDPATECLLQEPAWNFDWQRGYQYDTPMDSLPSMMPGDKITFRCTYDNTLANPFLAAALAEAGQKQTQPVTLGETTMDEMCLGAFWFVYKAP